MLRSHASWSRVAASRRWYSDKARLKVLFGSQLGTAEKYAQVVAMFARAHNFDVELSALDNCPPSKLQQEKLAVILTSTYGNGEFPRNAQQFWNELAESKTDLSALKYALFGLGNSHNEQFNEAAKLLDNKLKALGAKELAETVLSCELQPNGHDSKFQPWLQALWGALGTKAESAALPSSYRLELVDSATPCVIPSMPGYVSATVKANKPLTQSDPEREAWSLELDSAFISYELLDHVTIYPSPPAPLVDRLLKILHLDGSTKVKVVPTAAAHAALPLDNQVATIRDILHTIDISAIPSRTLISALAQSATDAAERANLEKLSQDMTPGNRYSGLAQKEVFTLVDLLDEFPSVHVSLEQLLTNCPAVQPRTYSISSDPRHKAGSMELCYALSTRSCSGNTFRGLCSGYMARLRPGDKVRIQVQPGLITNPGDKVPIVGVALGTGIGPFRALLQRRMDAKKAGETVAPMTLFFGFRHLAKDFLFREELLRYQTQGILQLVHSCSHDDPKHFETPIEKMAQHSGAIYDALAHGAYFVYCGLSGTVPTQVEHALRRVVESSAPEEIGANARAFIQKLRKAGRYQEESYSVDTDVENILSTTYSTTAPKPFVEKYADAKMFCFQCEQTHQNRGCTTVGVCGKTPDVAALQDLLVEGVKVLGWYCHHLRELSAAGANLPKDWLRDANHFSLEAMFSTLTNVNFDATRFVDYLRRCKELTQAAEQKYGELCKSLGRQQLFPHATGLPDIAEITHANVDSLVERGKDVGVVAQFRDGTSEEAVGVCEMLVYGLKGLCAYAHHSLVNNLEDERVFAYLHEACSFLLSEKRHDLGAAVGMSLKCGEVNITVLEMLYRSNTSFGKPEPTTVPVKPTPGKCILVSGHDLVALDSLLRATAGTGINVYTHGEMLPCHSYPQLKKYGNLVGHFGGAWNRQSVEFPFFPGPIVMTTNCLTEPKDSYKNRLFTVAAVGWQGIPHLAGDDLQKVDWTPVINKAKESRGFTTEKVFQYPLHAAISPQPESFTVGFGHEVVLGAAKTVLDEVSAGNIKRFFVIGGCDGYEGERSYYTDLAQRLPDESVILTLGCGKFRLNHLDKGTIGKTGIPRILDMGQCNDSYGAVQVALALAQALNCKVSDLPLSIVLSWFEQKAIVVLLTLLHLGIKPIRVGPSLPAFLKPAVVDVLVRDFGVRLVGNAEEDVKTMCSAVGAS